MSGERPADPTSSDPTSVDPGLGVAPQADRLVLVLAGDGRELFLELGLAHHLAFDDDLAGDAPVR